MTAVHRIIAARPHGTFETLLGLLMLPLSVIPIVLYLMGTPDGYLMYLRGRYALMPPATAKLDPAATTYAQGAFSKLSVDGIPVLVYHGIGRAGAEDPSKRYVVSRANFAQQMRALQAAGFHAVSVEDTARYLRSGDASLLPSRPVLITFDGERSDSMLQADPILRDTGLRAAVFVTGKDASASSLYNVGWGGLRGYASNGRWELENHTYGLQRSIDDVKGLLPLSELVRVAPGETLAAYGARVGQDIDRNQRLLTRNGGGRPDGFSYPFGDWGQHARTPGVVDALQRVLRSRFDIAFDQDRQAGWRFAMPGDDTMHVHRLEVGNWNADQFVDRLVAAAKLSQTSYRERGLDVHVDKRQLAAAAVDAACAPVSSTPVSSFPTARKVVALSFDDGPSPYTPQVLDVLREYGAHATFFVLGQNLQGRSRVLQRMLVSGNEIANGTWTAGSPSTLGADALSRELRRTDAAIETAVPFRPCLARPAGRQGVDRFAAVVAPLNLTTALWSVDPRDFATVDPKAIARRVLAAAQPGAIVILHDGGSRRWATVQALPRILRGLQARGYRAVSISTLLSGPAASTAGPTATTHAHRKAAAR